MEALDQKAGTKMLEKCRPPTANHELAGALKAAEKSGVDLSKYQVVCVQPFATEAGKNIDSTIGNDFGDEIHELLKNGFGPLFRDVRFGAPCGSACELIVTGTIKDYSPGSRLARSMLRVWVPPAFMPSWSSSTPQASRYCSKLLSAKRGRGVGSWDTQKELKTWSPRAPSRAQRQSPREKDGGQNEAGRSFTAFAANSRPIWRSTFLMKPTLHWAGVLGTLAFALLTMITACAQTIWTEGWQAAQTRTYVVTDTTEDAIFGDRGGWIVYDSAPDCNGAPHPNTAEIISVAGNKILKMTVVANDCVADLS